MTTDRALYSFKVPEPAGVLIINGTNNKPMVTIQRDGSIEFGPTYTPDEAARIFWQCIATWPSGHPAQLAAKDREIERLYAEQETDHFHMRRKDKLIEAAEQRAEANRKDAARYRWLGVRLDSVDFSYGSDGDPLRTVLVFALPDDARVSADLDATIDALAGVGAEASE